MDLKDNFNIYIGGKSGVFKGVRIGKEENVMQNIQNLVSITDHDEITAMSWGDDEEKEILIGCGVKGIRSVKVYDTDCSTFTCSFFCNIGTGKINGISRYDEALLTAVESGEVKLWRFKEEDEILIKAGKDLKRMRHSKINKNIIATGGYEHNLKLFDLKKQKQVFIEKNLPHDWLQLRVPIWISDIQFLPKTEQIVTVGRYGHVRLYDPKAQKRPVINMEMTDEALTTLSTMPREKQIIVGSGKGKMVLVDLRKPVRVLNTYKGFVGSVTGIACSTTEPYVVSVSLDRYLRIHHIDTKKLLKKVYLTSRMSCMLLRSEFSLPAENKISEERSINVKENIKEQENVQGISDSDLEYDTLFDKMQVVGNKGHKTSTEKKRKSTEEDSVLNRETVSRKSTLSKNEKSLKSSKRPKSKNPFILS